MTEEFDEENELKEPIPPDQHRSDTALDDLDMYRPEGLPEKFWDASTDSIRTDSLLKSYLQLEKRFSEPDAEKVPGQVRELLETLIWRASPEVSFPKPFLASYS